MHSITLAQPRRLPPPQSYRSGEIDAAFVDMLDAYRPTGGLARADDLVGLLRSRHKDGLATVARWIAAGQVVHCQWGGDYWLPMFQFSNPVLQPRPGLARVLAELSPALDAWDVALWFSRPNPWLGDALPSAVFATQAVQVEQAARADRFAFCG